MSTSQPKENNNNSLLPITIIEWIRIKKTPSHGLHKVPKVISNPHLTCYLQNKSLVHYTIHLIIVLIILLSSFDGLRITSFAQNRNNNNNNNNNNIPLIPTTTTSFTPPNSRPRSSLFASAHDIDMKIHRPNRDSDTIPASTSFIISFSSTKKLTPQDDLYFGYEAQPDPYYYWLMADITDNYAPIQNPLSRNQTIYCYWDLVTKDVKGKGEFNHDDLHLEPNTTLIQSDECLNDSNSFTLSNQHCGIIEKKTDENIKKFNPSSTTSQALPNNQSPPPNSMRIHVATFTLLPQTRHDPSNIPLNTPTPRLHVIRTIPPNQIFYCFARVPFFTTIYPTQPPPNSPNIIINSVLNQDLTPNTDFTLVDKLIIPKYTSLTVDPLRTNQPKITSLSQHRQGVSFSISFLFDMIQVSMENLPKDAIIPIHLEYATTLLKAHRAPVIYPSKGDEDLTPPPDANFTRNDSIQRQLASWLQYPFAYLPSQYNGAKQEHMNLCGGNGQVRLFSPLFHIDPPHDIDITTSQDPDETLNYQIYLITSPHIDEKEYTCTLPLNLWYVSKKYAIFRDWMNTPADHQKLQWCGLIWLRVVFEDVMAEKFATGWQYPPTNDPFEPDNLQFDNFRMVYKFDHLPKILENDDGSVEIWLTSEIRASLGDASHHFLVTDIESTNTEYFPDYTRMDCSRYATHPDQTKFFPMDITRVEGSQYFGGQFKVEPDSNYLNLLFCWRFLPVNHDDALNSSDGGDDIRSFNPMDMNQDYDGDYYDIDYHHNDEKRTKKITFNYDELHKSLKLDSNPLKAAELQNFHANNNKNASLRASDAPIRQIPPLVVFSELAISYSIATAFSHRFRYKKGSGRYVEICENVPSNLQIEGNNNNNDKNDKNYNGNDKNDKNYNGNDKSDKENDKSDDKNENLSPQSPECLPSSQSYLKYSFEAEFRLSFDLPPGVEFDRSILLLQQLAFHMKLFNTNLLLSPTSQPRCKMKHYDKDKKELPQGHTKASATQIKLCPLHRQDRCFNPIDPYEDLSKKSHEEVFWVVKGLFLPSDTIKVECNLPITSLPKPQLGLNGNGIEILFIDRFDGIDLVRDFVWEKSPGDQNNYQENREKGQENQEKSEQKEIRNLKEQQTWVNTLPTKTGWLKFIIQTPIPMTLPLNEPNYHYKWEVKGRDALEYNAQLFARIMHNLLDLLQNNLWSFGNSESLIPHKIPHEENPFKSLTRDMFYVDGDPVSGLNCPKYAKNPWGDFYGRDYLDHNPWESVVVGSSDGTQVVFMLPLDSLDTSVITEEWVNGVFVKFSHQDDQYRIVINYSPQSTHHLCTAGNAQDRYLNEDFIEVDPGCHSILGQRCNFVSDCQKIDGVDDGRHLLNQIKCLENVCSLSKWSTSYDDYILSNVDHWYRLRQGTGIPYSEDLDTADSAIVLSSVPISTHAGSTLVFLKIGCDYNNCNDVWFSAGNDVSVKFPCDPMVDNIDTTVIYTNVTVYNENFELLTLNNTTLDKYLLSSVTNSTASPSPQKIRLFDNLDPELLIEYPYEFRPQESIFVVLDLQQLFVVPDCPAGVMIQAYFSFGTSQYITSLPILPSIIPPVKYIEPDFRPVEQFLIGPSWDSQSGLPKPIFANVFEFSLFLHDLVYEWRQDSILRMMPTGLSQGAGLRQFYYNMVCTAYGKTLQPILKCVDPHDTVPCLDKNTQSRYLDFPFSQFSRVDFEQGTMAINCYSQDLPYSAHSQMARVFRTGGFGFVFTGYDQECHGQGDLVCSRTYASTRTQNLQLFDHSTIQPSDWIHHYIPRPVFRYSNYLRGVRVRSKDGVYERKHVYTSTFTFSSSRLPINKPFTEVPSGIINYADFSFSFIGHLIDTSSRQVEGYNSQLGTYTVFCEGYIANEPDNQNDDKINKTTSKTHHSFYPILRGDLMLVGRHFTEQKSVRIKLEASNEVIYSNAFFPPNLQCSGYILSFQHFFISKHHLPNNYIASVTGSLEFKQDLDDSEIAKLYSSFTQIRYVPNRIDIISSRALDHEESLKGFAISTSCPEFSQVFPILMVQGHDRDKNDDNNNNNNNNLEVINDGNNNNNNFINSLFTTFTNSNDPSTDYESGTLPPKSIYFDFTIDFAHGRDNYYWTGDRRNQPTFFNLTLFKPDWTFEVSETDHKQECIRFSSEDERKPPPTPPTQTQTHFSKQTQSQQQSTPSSQESAQDFSPQQSPNLSKYIPTPYRSTGMLDFKCTAKLSRADDPSKSIIEVYGRIHNPSLIQISPNPFPSSSLSSHGPSQTPSKMATLASLMNDESLDVADNGDVDNIDIDVQQEEEKEQEKLETFNIDLTYHIHCPGLHINWNSLENTIAPTYNEYIHDLHTSPIISLVIDQFNMTYHDFMWDAEVTQEDRLSLREILQLIGIFGGLAIAIIIFLFLLITMILWCCCRDHFETCMPRLDDWYDTMFTNLNEWCCGPSSSSSSSISSRHAKQDNGSSVLLLEDESSSFSLPPHRSDFGSTSLQSY